MSELNFGCSLYILDESGEQPVRCDDANEWADWYWESDLRRVGKTFLGKIFISTIFLGIDHGLDHTHPVLWETMVFRIGDGGIDEALECERCNGNREQALALHASMVERMEALLALGEDIDSYY
jgi:hypothetical protein